jgi:crotonobetainyl-CoA:carnitine CoA-transferase CaiB-like acyl-CoA transferase
MQGPLRGVRVIELAQDLAGAFAGQILADQGAEVIKIEPPQGDPLRHCGAYAEGESRLFQSLNRGKRSVVLDLADTNSHTALRRMVMAAHVLVTTFAAADLQTLGLQYHAIKDAPRLVHAHVSALGEHGPWSVAPMGPLCLQAFSGLMATEGKRLEDGSPAAIVSTDMVARATGVFTALGVSAALLHRHRTGRGQAVKLSKLAVSLFLQGPRTGDVPAADDRVRNPARDRMLAIRAEGGSFAELLAARGPIVNVPSQVFYRAYNTSDGAVFIGALSAPLRARARRAMETEFLHRDDPNWNPDDPDFLAYCAAQQAEIEERFRSRTTAEWIARCEAENVPAGEVAFPEDLAESEQAHANELMVWVDHPTAGRQLQAAPFIRFRRHAKPELSGSPTLGQDNADLTAPLML